MESIAITESPRAVRTTHFVIVAFAFLLLAGCGNQSKVDPKQPSEICVWKNGQWTTDWMQKYVEYARGKDNFYTDRRIMDEWQYWGLAYIDNDTIPEMLLYGSEAAGCKVLTIYEGKVSEWNSWRCGVSYIPKSGLINNEDGSMGHYYDRIVKLEDGEYTLVYMINYYEGIDYIDSNYVYYQGNKYSISDSPKEYERYTNDSVKHALYTSYGQSVDINFDSLYPTVFFEKDWTPTLPDNVAEEAYTLTIIVK